MSQQRAFLTTLAEIQIPKNVEEALIRLKWKETVFEEIRDLEKNST